MRGLLVAVAAALVVAGTAAAAPQRPWLWQCTQIHNAEVQYRCYVRLLRQDIESSRDPARELPRIDRRVVAVGGPLQAGCHVLMHEVGREFGRDHRVTLSTLQRYVPRSNDPNCSAGFGMGLVMYLGPQILRSGGAAAVRSCAGLPTRYREYTCVHGLGHALLRAYHGAIGEAVAACRRLQARYAPDCAQGVFHDYWISLRGADGTTRPERALGSPRVLCDGRFTYVRPCWYRYFLEQPVGAPIRTATDVRRTCRGLSAIERFACIGAATLVVSGDPFEQMRLCLRLRGRDAAACVRGVADQALAGKPARQLALIQMCRTADCSEWIGRTLAVVTNGRFRCDVLSSRARGPCRVGAARLRDALVTFS
ncbi:MAG: hypothetical protein ACJ74B_08775 [Gaiellaceae bacterium]